MGPPTQRSISPERDEEPPHDQEDFDSTDSPGRQPATRRRRYEERIYRRNVSTIDEVLGEASGYVTSFIADRMDQDGHSVPEEMRAATTNVKR